MRDREREKVCVCVCVCVKGPDVCPNNEKHLLLSAMASKGCASALYAFFHTYTPLQRFSASACALINNNKFAPDTN